MTNTIQTNILPKPFTNRGVVHSRMNDTGAIFNAEISKTSIRIFGVYTNHVNGPQLFNRVFKIGHEVVVDSWNIVFTGPIKKIGPKSVTIFNKTRDKNTRLDLFDFIRRNWDFNIEKINKRNSEWMD